jgi:hypothetical protein
MNKIILSLFAIISLHNFAYNEPQIILKKNISKVIVNKNEKQIKELVDKVLTNNEIFKLTEYYKDLTNPDYLSVEETQDPNYLEKKLKSKKIIEIKKIYAKYYKIKIEEIKFISKNKAIAKIKISIPDEKYKIKDADDKFQEITGKHPEIYASEIKNNNPKEIKLFDEITLKSIIEAREETLINAVKAKKYKEKVITLTLIKKGNKWIKQQ